MVVKLNFNLEAWVRELEIYADSEEDAIQKLMGMSLAEIVEDAVVDSEMNITEVETAIVDYDVIVQVTDIDYDFSSEDMDPGVMDYLRTRLPKEINATISGVTDSDDIEDLIKDKIYSDTGYDTKSFEFQILGKK